MTEPTLNPESGFRRLRIELAYDGTNFSGWAKQKDQRTLQEEIEHVISKLVRHSAETIVAGRTDAGVHASHQIIHVDLPADRVEVDNFGYLMNRFLSPEIRVNDVREAPAHFHARFSALSRQYEYKLLDGGRALAPLDRFDKATWYRPLDLDLLNAASGVVVGENDFFAFCKYRQGSTTIRNLMEFSWRRDSSGTLIATLRADAFCYSMVRNLVGAAVCVGEGRYSVEWMAQTLADRVRIPNSYVFPAQGLTLTNVAYPSDDKLLDRISQTLGKRASDF